MMRLRDIVSDPPIYAMTVVLLACFAVLSSVYMVSALPVGLLFLLAVANWIRTRSRLPLLAWVLIAVHAYWLLSVLFVGGTPASLDARFIRWQIRSFLCFIPLLSLLILNLKFSGRVVNWFVALLLGAASVVALIAAVQFLMGWRYPVVAALGFCIAPVRTWNNTDWFLGYLGSHSAAGGFYHIVVTMLAALFLLWKTSLRNKILLAVVLLLTCWALAFAKSRLFWAAMACAVLMLLGVYWWNARKTNKSMAHFPWAASIGHSLAVCAIVGFSYFAVADLHERMMAGTDVVHVAAARAPSPLDNMEEPPEGIDEETYAGDATDKSVTERVLYWRQAWQMFRKHPLFGVGFGRFGRSLPPRVAWRLRTRGTTPHVDMAHAHNSLLHLLAETGIVGCSLAVAFWVLLIRALLRRLLGQRVGSLAYVVTCGVLAAILSQMLASLADYNLGAPSIMMPLTGLAGLILCMTGGDRPDSSVSLDGGVL